MPITPTMKILRPAFALLWFAVAAHATAQAYKCLDPHGKIEYRGSPCAASAEHHNAPPPSSVSAAASGAICTGPYSWDACRKLGVDSVVDCKRMDEDVVFRVGVLQSKGIQCRYTEAGRRQHP